MPVAAYRIKVSFVLGALLVTLSKDIWATASAATEIDQNATGLTGGAAGANKRNDTKLEIQKCLDSTETPSPTSQQDFLDGKSSRLQLHQAWHSRKKPQLAEPTILTALTPGRLNQLKSQCQNWPGPLSATMYVAIELCHTASPAPSTANRRLLQLQQSESCLKDVSDTDELAARGLAEAAKSIAALQAEMDQQPGSCALDILLLYELVTDHSLADLLPINQLRNYAAMQARTDLVAMVDVDLIPSRTLSQFLMKQDNLKQLQQICSKKAAVVVPAFQTAPQITNQTAGHEIAAAAAASNKQQLKKLVEQQLVFQFHMAHYRQGHDCTNYHLWMNSYQYYSVKDCWTSGYEPWYIVNRRLNPYYDQLFRGYGWNKVSHVTQTYHAGFDFQVIEDGFLIHREHETSAASKEFFDLTVRTRPESLKATNQRFRKRVIDQMKRRSYQPVTDVGFQACLQQLPWWKEQQPVMTAGPAVSMVSN